MFSITLPASIEKEDRLLPTPWMLQYYKELDRRELWIEDDIGEDTIDIIKRIKEWNEEDAKYKQKLADQEDRRDSAFLPYEPRTSQTLLSQKPFNFNLPITIYFNSDGGDLEMSLAVASAVKESVIPIHGHNIGGCSSGAALIYSQCDVRTMEETAHFLIHKGGVSGMGGTFQQTKKVQRHYEWQVDRMMDFMYSAFNPKELSRETFEELVDSEWYLYYDHKENNQNAKLLGLITK